jgi:hypothetical protein
MKAKLLRLFPLVLIVLVGMLVWHDQGQRGDVVPHSLVCSDLHQGCGLDLDGKSVRVSVAGQLKPLQPFQLRVEAPHARKVQARFTMEGMDMGFNLYALRADKRGVFQANVTLPVCVSGRRDWIMHLDVDGAKITVPFVTDL